MQASNYKTNTKFKNKITGHIWEVQIIEDMKYFVNLEYGDACKSLYDDYFERSNVKNYCEECNDCVCNTCLRAHEQIGYVCNGWCENSDYGCGKNGSSKIKECSRYSAIKDNFNKEMAK